MHCVCKIAGWQVYEIATIPSHSRPLLSWSLLPKTELGLIKPVEPVRLGLGELSV